MFAIDLDPNWSPVNSFAKLPFEKFKFSGGEVHLKLGNGIGVSNHVLISHRLNSSDNLMELLLAADAIRRKCEDATISAYIPYLPYARQDKVMVEGKEPFSLMVLARILATAGFKHIYCLDPHSDIAPAIIPNLRAITPTYLLYTREEIERRFGDYVMLAPDGGALKKIYKNAQYVGYKGNIHCASKLRNVETGEIIRTTIDGTVEDFGGKTVWIQDDILDGGRTFIELAK